MKFLDYLDYQILGALFGAILFALFTAVIGNGLVRSEAPDKPGFDLPSGVAAPAKAAAPAEAVPLPSLLAKADPARGQALTKVCATCHSFEKGAPAKVGPNLFGVVDRAKGSEAGFGYSDAMKAKGGKWTFEDINAFITSPKTFVDGTKMAFGGEPDAGKRADLIVYLRSLSDSPAALPAAN
jgi:cytochrome c